MVGHLSVESRELGKSSSVSSSVCLKFLRARLTAILSSSPIDVLPKLPPPPPPLPPLLPPPLGRVISVTHSGIDFIESVCNQYNFSSFKYTSVRT